MTTPRPSRFADLLSRLQTATGTWWSQVLFFLGLVVLLIVVDRLVVADFYRKYFYYPGSIFNWLFFAGEWIPALGGAISVAIAIQGRMTFAYFITVAVLTGVSSIAYCYLADLDFGRDRMLGSAAPVYAWMFFWFCGGVTGSVVRLIMGRLSWHTNSK